MTDLFVGDEIETGEQSRDVAVLEIKAEQCNPASHDFIDILVQKPEKADRERKNEQSLNEIVTGDSAQAAGGFFFLRTHGVKCGLSVGAQCAKPIAVHQMRHSILAASVCRQSWRPIRELRWSDG